ncbi:MAG: glutamine synthetase family protein [Pseudomonadota bacterium]
MTTNKFAAAGDLERFLESHPEIESIDAVFPDMCGIIRGKRLSVAHARQLFREGLQIPGSMLLLAVNGSCMDPLGRGVSDGDPDVLIRPLADSLIALPWAQPPRGQVTVSFLDATGTESSLEPRNLLAKVAARFNELGLQPVVACELEFCLIDRERDGNGAPRRAVSPVAGCRHESAQLMGLAQLDDFGEYADNVVTACRELGLPVTALNAEYGGDQFEINLRHVDSALQAADHAVLLKELVQRAAVHHDLRATFMAKPYTAAAGSGMHWHVSLLDADGNNAFDDGGARGSDTLRHAVAGVLETMPEAMGFYAPNINSYRRFKPGLFVPMSRSWGYNNRSVALRVPGGKSRDRRLEFRVPGADANPYLALAALLSGMHHGIDEKLAPVAASEGNACEERDDGLPLRLFDALQALDKAAILPAYLGADYCAVYAATKRLELDAFLEELSAREFDWYLRSDA